MNHSRKTQIVGMWKAGACATRMVRRTALARQPPLGSVATHLLGRHPSRVLQALPRALSTASSPASGSSAASVWEGG